MIGRGHQDGQVKSFKTALLFPCTMSDKRFNLYQAFDVDSLEGLMLQDGQVMISAKAWHLESRYHVFDFVDCGDHIMTLLNIIIPNPDDIWMMMPHQNS